MGRFILFLIIIAAALAGAWFYLPGGKDMLLGAKEKAMGYLPGGAADEATAEPIVEDVEPMEEAVEEAAEAIEESSDAEASAEEPQQ